MNNARELQSLEIYEDIPIPRVTGRDKEDMLIRK
jgi:hypothetical protein